MSEMQSDTTQYEETRARDERHREAGMWLLKVMQQYNVDRDTLIMLVTIYKNGVRLFENVRHKIT